MDITPVQTLNMAPPTSSGPAGDEATETASVAQHEAPTSTNGATNQPIGAAAAAQQPKVVQTAFIHKLYKYGQTPLLQVRIVGSLTGV